MIQVLIEVAQASRPVRHSIFSDSLISGASPVHNESALQILSGTTLNQFSKGHGETLCSGRVLALDPGAKRVGVAVSDELCITVRALAPLRRASWKQLLRDVIKHMTTFDARALVIGLPLRLDGVEGVAAAAARRLAQNFARSLPVPVYLQDERLTSRAALENLRAAGLSGDELRTRLDSESAVIILLDFIAAGQNSADAVKPWTKA